jgi:3-deoxy-7-phosphoheptulonate synthase
LQTIPITTISAKDITQQIVEGNLSIPENFDKLKYGVSVTDACINWEDTEILLKNMINRLADPLKKRLSNALAYVQK